MSSTYLLVQGDNLSDLDKLGEILRSHGLSADKVTLADEATGIVWHKDDEDMLTLIAEQMESYKDRRYE